MTAHRSTYSRPHCADAVRHRAGWHWNRGAVLLFTLTFALILAAMLTLSAIASSTDGDLLPPVTVSHPGTLAEPCATDGEEVGPCYWDADAMGNGTGRSYTLDADGTVTYWDGRP